MSDYDYGRANGLWGNDGIPYGLDCYDSSNYFSTPKYTRSENVAISQGYKEVEDASAYNGRYFIKNGLKWIHNISALKKMLRIYADEDLIAMGYDAQAYYQYNK